MLSRLFYIKVDLQYHLGLEENWNVIFLHLVRICNDESRCRLLFDFQSSDFGRLVFYPISFPELMRVPEGSLDPSSHLPKWEIDKLEALPGVGYPL